MLPPPGPEPEPEEREEGGAAIPRAWGEAPDAPARAATLATVQGRRPLPSAALVLLDPDAARWWLAGDAATGAEAPVVFCGALKAWAVLERAGRDGAVRWLGPLGADDWEALAPRLADWHAQLAAVPPLAAGGAAGGALAELLSGDLATPALLALALLPAWAEALAGFEEVRLPVGRGFRPPRFGRLGDLPLLALAAVLRGEGRRVRLLAELERGLEGEAAPAPTGGPQAAEGWTAPPLSGAAWLTTGKLRHPEHPLLALEAAGLPVALFEAEPAAPLPDLFAGTARLRCHGRLDAGGPAAPAPDPPPLPAAPEGGAVAAAAAWWTCLEHWPPLRAEAEAIGRERLRLDHLLAGELRRQAPTLLLVPEENGLSVERLLQAARAASVPHAVLHHTADVLPLQGIGRWQRHLRPADPRLVPLRAQRRSAADPAETGEAAVLLLDPVRAHLLDGVELERPLPPAPAPAAGWLHYPLQQQSPLPLADPAAYWAAFDRVHDDLAARGVPLALARKPPLEPAGLGDAAAQGLRARPAVLPLARLLAESTVVIAPGHLGTGHLEAIARGRPVVLVIPERLRRPSLLLEAADAPFPRLTAAGFAAWFAAQDAEALAALAVRQAEWLRGQLVTTSSLMGWLDAIGVAAPARPQRFLGSGLMAQRPLMERVEAMDRLSRRLQRLRGSAAGRRLTGLLARLRGRRAA